MTFDYNFFGRKEKEEYVRKQGSFFTDKQNDYRIDAYWLSGIFTKNISYGQTYSWNYRVAKIP